MIRILLVEDSVTQREILRRLICADSSFVIVGEARNGREAVGLVESTRPDVVLMDIHMPDMDGVTATREIMQRSPMPVVIASASLRQEDVDLGLEALKAGAVSVIEKPQGAVLLHLEKIAPALHAELIAAAKATVVRKRQRARVTPSPQFFQLEGLGEVEIVGLCASTGGPPVLLEILTNLPRPFPIPILLVQHIADGFVEGFSRWLRDLTGHPVRLVKPPGETLEPGIWLSPGRRHLTLSSRRRVQLIPRSDQDIHCPSGNLLFSSMAEHAGHKGLGILLTGMGDDGAQGLLKLRKAEGRTVVQDEATSLIYGMPKVARELGAAEVETSPEGVIQVLCEVARRRPSTGS